MRHETLLNFGAVIMGFSIAEGPFVPVLKYQAGLC